MTDISARLGFERPSAFSQWFQQQFGVSPSEWRETTTEASPAPTRDETGSPRVDASSPA